MESKKQSKDMSEEEKLKLLKYAKEAKVTLNIMKVGYETKKEELKVTVKNWENAVQEKANFENRVKILEDQLADTTTKLTNLNKNNDLCEVLQAKLDNAERKLLEVKVQNERTDILEKELKQVKTLCATLEDENKLIKKFEKELEEKQNEVNKAQEETAMLKRQLLDKESSLAKVQKLNDYDALEQACFEGMWKTIDEEDEYYNQLQMRQCLGNKTGTNQYLCKMCHASGLSTMQNRSYQLNGDWNDKRSFFAHIGYNHVESCVICHSSISRISFYNHYKPNSKCRELNHFIGSKLFVDKKMNKQ